MAKRCRIDSKTLTPAQLWELREALNGYGHMASTIGSPLQALDVIEFDESPTLKELESALPLLQKCTITPI